MIPARPLDRVGSIKVKLGLLVAASILVSALVIAIGSKAEVPGWISVPATMALALLVTLWLARGMTEPLREMTAAAERMADGDYSQRVTATSADEIGTLARTFNQMSADLATVDQQRRDLVSTVSHELRTPLAAQRAVLENLVDGVVSPDDKVLGGALAQAERISELVEDLLDLSRVDGGARSLRLTEVRVSDLLDAAVAEAGLSHRDVKHEVRVEPADLTVRADPARMAQVVTNLLDNAARHSPTGGRVTVTAHSDGPDHWLLEVADDGPGIPEASRAKVFERFGTGDTSGGGTGLGLAIARWVCQLHGGAIIAVDPEPGRSGARIRVALPISPASRVATDTNAPATLPPPMVETRPPAPSLPPSRPALAPAAAAITTPSPVRGGTMSTTIQPPPAGPPAPPGAPPPTGPPGPPPGSPEGRQPTPYNPHARRPDDRPFLDALFGDFWPEKGITAVPWVVLGAAAIGLLAAIVLPYRNLGVGVFLVLVASAALMWAVAKRRREPWTIASAAVSLGLGLLVLLRADEGVVVFGVMIVGVLTTTALTGARSLIAIVISGLTWVLSALRGLPLLGRTMATLHRRAALWAIVRTALVSVVLIVVFGALFASADALFGSWVDALIPELDWASFTFRSFVWFVFTGVVLTGSYLALNPPNMSTIAIPAGRPVRRAWEWFVPLGALLAVFTAFIASQAAALDREYVARTTGLSYGDYVHQGFGQLTVATILTLGVVGVAARRMPRGSTIEHRTARGMLAALCVLTLAVVTSALVRMYFYHDAYGFTTLRIYVDAFELWLGIVMVMVLVAVLTSWRPHRPTWLARGALMSGAVIVLVLGWMNPDAWVAQRNIDRHLTAGTSLDAAYLAGLGADAVPVVADSRLPGDVKGCVLQELLVTYDDDWLSWNLGRARATATFERLGIEDMSTDVSRYRSINRACNEILYSQTSG